MGRKGNYIFMVALASILTGAGVTALSVSPLLKAAISLCILAPVLLVIRGVYRISVAKAAAAEAGQDHRSPVTPHV